MYFIVADSREGQRQRLCRRRGLFEGRSTARTALPAHEQRWIQLSFILAFVFLSYFFPLCAHGKPRLLFPFVSSSPPHLMCLCFLFAIAVKYSVLLNDFCSPCHPSRGPCLISMPTSIPRLASTCNLII